MRHSSSLKLITSAKVSGSYLRTPGHRTQKIDVTDRAGSEQHIPPHTRNCPAMVVLRHHFRPGEMFNIQLLRKSESAYLAMSLRALSDYKVLQLLATSRSSDSCLIVTGRRTLQKKDWAGQGPLLTLHAQATCGWPRGSFRK